MYTKLPIFNIQSQLNSRGLGLYCILIELIAYRQVLQNYTFIHSISLSVCFVRFVHCLSVINDPITMIAR